MPDQNEYHETDGKRLERRMVNQKRQDQDNDMVNNYSHDKCPRLLLLRLDKGAISA